jgi:hypothetical protein
MLAWGLSVSAAFRSSVVAMAAHLLIEDPSWLMACMAFETGETFRPDIRNAAGSGAIGLIQFMPSQALALGTSTEELAHMTAEDQLHYVLGYFEPYTGRLKNLGDVYGAILWPAMIGKPDSHVVFDESDKRHPARYLQNKGLDTDENGFITRGEIVSRIAAKLAKGLAPPHVWAGLI